MSTTASGVLIYSSPLCGYCTAARRLLRTKGVTFTEIDVLAEPERRMEMMERSGGRRTVPQVFIHGTHAGGYDDLVQLDREGRLDALLAGSAEPDSLSTQT